MRVLIIIPAYNEEENILNTVKSIEKIKIKNVVLDYVIINDGSKDSTKEVCLKNNLNFVDLPFNLGIGGAVQTGYKYAYYNDYDVAIQVDGDSQHNPNYIKTLIEEIEKGNDFVIGSRFVKELSSFKSSKIRRVGISWLSIITKLVTGKKIYDPTSGFRAANKEIIKLFSDDYPVDYPEPDTNAMLAKKGFKISEIPVEMNPRTAGKSSISPFKSIHYMLKVSFSIILIGIIYKGGKK